MFSFCDCGYSGKDSVSAGAVDEEDFIKAFEDVPAVQVMQQIMKI